MRTAVAPHIRTCIPPRLPTRIERETAADAVYKHRGDALLYTCVVVDPATWEPRPEYAHLTLLVNAHTRPEARHAWERHALDLDAEGKLQVAITCTPPVVGNRRQKEETLGFLIDLDMLLLGDELDEMDAADRALGL